MLKGSLGLPLVGETVPFLRDPVSFVTIRLARYGAVFRTNVLAQPTVFACTYASALDVLQPSAGPSAEAGDAYAEFLGPIYPSPNQLLLNSDSALRADLIAKFGAVFSEDAVRNYRPAIAAIARHALAQLHSRKPSPPANSVLRLPLYATFKPLCERVVTTLLLGALPEPDLREVRALCSTHFRALVAVPVHVDVLGRRSARADAARARTRLLEIISRAVTAECSRQLGSAGATAGGAGTPFAALVARIGGARASRADRALLADHLLLLLSSAVPKSIASGLVSLFASLSAPAGTPPANPSSGAALRAALLEALRLHPPLLGGLRVTGTSGSCVVAGAAVPPRHRLWFSALHANRDPAVYETPAQFHPARWRDLVAQGGCPFARRPRRPQKDDGAPVPLTFGAGARACPGRFLAWQVMAVVAEEVCAVGQILRRKESEDGGAAEMRYLPVCRPVEEIVLEIRKRD